MNLCNSCPQLWPRNGVRCCAMSYYFPWDTLLHNTKAQTSSPGQLACMAPQLTLLPSTACQSEVEDRRWLASCVNPSPYPGLYRRPIIAHHNVLVPNGCCQNPPISRLLFLVAQVDNFPGKPFSRSTSSQIRKKSSETGVRSVPIQVQTSRSLINFLPYVRVEVLPYGLPRRFVTNVNIT